MRLKLESNTFVGPEVIYLVTVLMYCVELLQDQLVLFWRQRPGGAQLAVPE